MMALVSLEKKEFICVLWLSTGTNNCMIKFVRHRVLKVAFQIHFCWSHTSLFKFLSHTKEMVK